MRRLVPDITLPAYAFVPGLHPHPFSDPAGHRFRAANFDPPPDSFRLGIDLFNNGYYWEAHEVWEGEWNAHGRRGTEATFFKALIQLAVAGVKVREGRSDGVATHARRAAELLEELIAQGMAEHRGLNLATCRTYAETIAGVPPTVARTTATVVVFDFALAVKL